MCRILDLKRIFKKQEIYGSPWKGPIIMLVADERLIGTPANAVDIVMWIIGQNWLKWPYHVLEKRLLVSYWLGVFVNAQKYRATYG